MSLLDQAAARFSPSASQQNAFSMFWLARLHVANARGVAATIMESLPSYAESPFRPRHLKNSVQAFPSPFPSHFEQSALGRRPVGMPVRLGHQQSPSYENEEDHRMGPGHGAPP